MKYFRQFSCVALLTGMAVLSACGGSGYGGSSSTSSTSSSTSSTSSVAASSVSSASYSSAAPGVTGELYSLAGFPIGVGVPVGEEGSSLLESPERQALVNTYFSEITAENIMKPAFLHPVANLYYWDDADSLINWALANGKAVHGHLLLWHNQNPYWITHFQGNQAQWEAMMTAHIRAVVDHFKGNVVAWDVVNEALTDAAESSYRTDSIWYKGVGEDYIAKAFTAAREADAYVDLFYNDYAIAANTSKTQALLTMIDDLQSRDIPINGIGFQMHVFLDTPSIAAMKASWAAVVSRGLKVKLSELDVRTSINGEAYPEGLPADIERLQAQRYQAIVEAYMETVPPAQRAGITVWGITDGDSWLSGQWPVLFNEDFSGKQALQYFSDALTQ